MEFRIADTFVDSLARLSGDEQKATKTTAFDLQTDPSNPGMQYHKLHKAKDKNFWSVRVSGSIRMIVHKTDASLLLCYVDHHDHAYNWAERRKLETHPKTGAAQLVELRERVEEVIIPKYVDVEQPAQPKPSLFAHVSDDDLLGYGVPEEWLEDVRRVDEDSLLNLADHLPSEAAEALRRHGICRKEFQYFTGENEFLSHPGRVYRASCVLDPGKLAAHGVRMLEVHESLERTLRAWKKA